MLRRLLIVVVLVFPVVPADTALAAEARCTLTAHNPSRDAVGRPGLQAWVASGAAAVSCDRFVTKMTVKSQLSKRSVNSVWVDRAEDAQACTNCMSLHATATVPCDGEGWWMTEGKGAFLDYVTGARDYSMSGKSAEVLMDCLLPAVDPPEAQR